MRGQVGNEPFVENYNELGGNELGVSEKLGIDRKNKACYYKNRTFVFFI